MVRIPRDNAKKAGVDQLVRFERADVFSVDLSTADVIAVYLLPNQLRLLVPKLKKLKPGARVVSHQFSIPTIEPEKTIEMESQEDGERHAIHLWTAPVK